VSVKFVSPAPAMPSQDVPLAVEFYGEVLGILDPDGNLVTFWQQR
jgi:hypothetical protein